MSGDIVYTENLLAAPPRGVSYTTYDQAIEQGVLHVRGVRGAEGLTDRMIRIGRGVEILARRRGVMFREPCWYVSTTPGAFDLVHQHLFAVRQVGPRIPVFSSAGYPLDVRYRDNDGWSPARTRIARSLELGLNTLSQVHSPWLHHVRPAISSAYTEEFRQEFVRRGVPESQTCVLGTYLATEALPQRQSDGSSLAFVGRDFARKGGPVALNAFSMLHQADPRLRLHIVTSDVNARAIPARSGVVVSGELPNHRVLALLAHTDVLLAPTSSDCGAPYGVLEALRAGCSVILAQNRWLDERLAQPAVSRTRPEPRDVAAAAKIEVERRRHDPAACAAEARALWRRWFSEGAFHEGLLAGYRRAVSVAG